MNGNPAGLVSANTSGESDFVKRRRIALTAFNECAAAAAQVGEWKLQREAEDAAARCIGAIQQDERQQALQLGSVDGENPQTAREEEG